MEEGVVSCSLDSSCCFCCCCCCCWRCVVLLVVAWEERVEGLETDELLEGVEATLVDRDDGPAGMTAKNANEAKGAGLEMSKQVCYAAVASSRDWLCVKQAVRAEGAMVQSVDVDSTTESGEDNMHVVWCVVDCKDCVVSGWMAGSDRLYRAVGLRP